MYLSYYGTVCLRTEAKKYTYLATITKKKFEVKNSLQIWDGKEKERQSNSYTRLDWNDRRVLYLKKYLTKSNVRLISKISTLWLINCDQNHDKVYVMYAWSVQKQCKEGDDLGKWYLVWEQWILMNAKNKVNHLTFAMRIIIKFLSNYTFK